MKNLEKLTGATDVELAMFLMLHIDHPCSMQVENRTVNLRYFYINQAQKVLSRLKNSYAKNLLQSKIEEYQFRESSR